MVLIPVGFGIRRLANILGFLGMECCLALLDLAFTRQAILKAADSSTVVAASATVGEVIEAEAIVVEEASTVVAVSMGVVDFTEVGVATQVVAEAPLSNLFIQINEGVVIYDALSLWSTCEASDRAHEGLIGDKN